MILSKVVEKKSIIKIYIGRLLLFFNEFSDQVRKNRLSIYAACTAFYIFMSFIPVLIIAISLVPYLPITQSNLLEAILKLVPNEIEGIVVDLVTDLYDNHVRALSISIIAIIWASARGILGITQGLNEIHGIKENRNFIVMRIRSAFFTLNLVLGMMIMVVISVFGSSIMQLLNTHLPVPDFVNQIFSFKGLIIVSFLFILFMFLFVTLPAKRVRIKSQIVGALLAAVLWWLFSELFSYYVANYSNYSSVYGSFAVIIFMGVWLYTGMFIMFLGAQLNESLKNKGFS